MAPVQANMLLITNQTLAGRSASRRMYHGNQKRPVRHEHPQIRPFLDEAQLFAALDAVEHVNLEIAWAARPPGPPALGSAR